MKKTNLKNPLYEKTENDKMIKRCTREDCQELIVRKTSKYCINHCSRKVRERVLNESKTSEVIIGIMRTEEMKRRDEEILTERMLREEQEAEYEETMRMDMERIMRKENEESHKIQMENERLSEIQNKRQNLMDEEKNTVFYKFKIAILNISTIGSFSERSSISILFDFVDVFIHDNKIDDIFKNSYELILYPNITITREMSLYNLSDVIKTSNNKIAVKVCEDERKIE